MKPEVLLLEDDVAIAGTIVYALQREGFAVRHACLVQAAQAAVAERLPALAVLDVALPDGNGLDLCRQWRSSTQRGLSQLPVLMLTARGEEIDRVLGLEAGADDYLCKPFSPRELVARLRALARRAAMPATAQGLTAVGAFQLDEAGRRVHFAGQPLPLTRMEYGLLRELLRAPRRIVSREALFERVWGEHADSLERTVDTHMKTLRAKLRRVRADLEPIVTHRGMGYMLEP